MTTQGMRVADLMTSDVHSVSASTSDTEALAVMEKWKIRHLPVLDEQRKVVGIVSDRDLHGAIATRRDRKIAELMTTPVHTIGGNAPAHEAATVMLTQRFSSLPVVDEAGVLVGVITNTDFVELARKLLQEIEIARRS